jgi:fimbrial chaperone protein
MTKTALVVLAMAFASTAHAASLRIAPILVEISEPAKTAVVTLRNEGDKAITVQSRIMRWSQSNGEDRLEPATGVVTSPPIRTIAPGAENVVRIVRVDDTNAKGEEAYRLIIDQLPDPKQRKPNTVNLLIRHSVPVFLSGAGSTKPRLSWSIKRSGGNLLVSATNSGGSHVRISDFGLKTPGGEEIAKANGLVGYVLAGSTVRWRFALLRKSYSGVVTLVARSETGPVHAQVKVDR